MRATALAARGLSVTFPARPKAVEALRGVDLEIAQGSLFVLLGPNGAGKTTLMRCITGLVTPVSGELSVLGGPPPSAAGGPGGGREALRRIGVLIENPGAYARLDVREYLSFFGSFYGVADLPGRIRDLCAQFALETGGRPVAKLSQGNRQKLQLVRSLLHDPELLLWDEPTDHLDPESQREVLGYLRSYLEKTGATALVATHRLEQMERVAGHFGFLRAGRMVKSGPREEILGAGGVTRARLRFGAEVSPGELEPMARALGAAATPDGTRGAELAAPDLQARLPALIKALANAFPLESVEPVRAGLPEIYAALMGED